MTGRLQDPGPLVISSWRHWVAGATLVISAAAWTYRFVDEYSRWSEVWFYVLVPLAVWALLAAAIWMIGSRRRWVKVPGGILLLPAALLWALSVLVGLYGLKIH